MSQKTTILRHLKMKGSISAAEALVVHRIFRLAARIKDLRNDGILIDTRMKRDATGKAYARYRLA